MHTPDDSIKMPDNTLGNYTQRFQSGDSRDLGSQRNSHDQTCLQSKTNMEMDQRHQLITLECVLYFIPKNKNHA